MICINTVITVQIVYENLRGNYTVIQSYNYYWLYIYIYIWGSHLVKSIFSWIGNSFFVLREIQIYFTIWVLFYEIVNRIWHGVIFFVMWSTISCTVIKYLPYSTIIFGFFFLNMRVVYEWVVQSRNSTWFYKRIDGSTSDIYNMLPQILFWLNKWTNKIN